MNAKKVFRAYTNNLARDIQDLVDHTERVVSLCNEFADSFPDEVNRKRLLNAAWLHDIAKYRRKKHRIFSQPHHNKPKNVKRAVASVSPYINKPKLKPVTKIIVSHKGEFAPKSNELESAILRVCDKLDRFAKGKADAREKCEESLRKIWWSFSLNDAQFRTLESLCEAKMRQFEDGTELLDF